MRAVTVLVLMALAGCGLGLGQEAFERVRLADGLEVSWPRAGKVPGRDQEGQRPGGAPELVLRLRATGEKPVVICRVLRVDDDEGEPGDRAFVRDPEPGAFEYDPASDCILAHSRKVTPFSLAPAFRWYELVLHPAGEEVTVGLGRDGGSAEGGEARRPVHLLLEYVPLSYYRLARAGYVAQRRPSPSDEAQGPDEEDVSVVRYHRLTEAQLRRSRPRGLFLRSGFLPPRARIALEIWLEATP